MSKEDAVNILNQFMSNGISVSYHLDQSISILRVFGRNFSFYSVFYIVSCKQTVETPIRCRFLRHLVWVCTVCLCPTKRTLGLYGLNFEH